MAGSWQIKSLAAYPMAIQNAAVVNMNDGYIYSFGGMNAASEWVSNSYRYCIATDSWEQINGIPASDVHWPYAVHDTVNDCCLIFYTSGTSTVMRSLSYYPSSGWGSAVMTADVLEFPAVRYCAVYNGTVYILHNSNGINRMGTYNLTTTAWNVINANVGGGQLAAGPATIMFCSCLDKIMWAADLNATTTYIYNISTNNAGNINNSVPLAAGANSRNYANSWTIGSKAFAYGGNDNTGVPENVDEFDFNTREWIKDADGIHSLRAYEATIPATTLSRATSVVVDGSAYILGGNPSPSTPATVVNTFQKFAYYLDKPTGFTAQYLPNGAGIKLDWVDNTTEETEYVIERKRDDAMVFSELATVPVIVGSNYTYTDVGIAVDPINGVDILNFSYQYKIKARLITL